MSRTNFTVTSYELRIGEDRAMLTLESTLTPNLMGGERVAVVDYVVGAEPSQLINRGGFLSVRRPLELLAPTLAVLGACHTVEIDDSGTVQVSGSVGSIASGAQE